MCNTCSVMRIVWGHWPSAHTTEKWLIGNWNCYIKFRGMAHWNFNFIWKNGKWPLPWFAHPYHCMLLLILELKDKLKLCVICMYKLVIYIYIWYGLLCYMWRVVLANSSDSPTQPEQTGATFPQLKQTLEVYTVYTYSACGCGTTMDATLSNRFSSHAGIGVIITKA